MKDSSTSYASIAGDGTLPVMQGVPITSTVEVIAPAAMNGGYQFSVDIEGRHVLVAVPEGGVKEGQQFRALVINNDVDGTIISGGHNIPTGRWRDDLCDCLKNPTLCCFTWCCTPVVLGQILTRNNMDWFGSPLDGRVTFMSAFKVMLLLFVSYSLLDAVMTYITSPYTRGEYSEETGVYVLPDDIPSWVQIVDIIHQTLTYIYALFILIVVIRTRKYIRTKYQIPESSCHGCEDCCCSFWCSPCTICQIGRHTADYSQYNLSCCSETGLDPMAPEVV